MTIGSFRLNTIAMGASAPTALDSYWVSTFTATSVVSSVDVDSSGNVYICGNTVVSSNPASFVIKLPSDAASITWQRYTKASSTSACESFGVVANGGGAIITSRTTNSGGGYNIGMVTKWNSSGTYQTASNWVYDFSNTNMQLRDIKLSSGTAPVAVGIMYKGSATYQLTIIKWTGVDFGTISWGRALLATSPQSIPKVYIGSSNEVYTIANCSTSGQTAGGNDIFIVKYGNTGTLSWQKTIGGASSDYGGGIVADSSSNPIISGIYNNGTTNLLYIAKLNTAASSITWQRAFTASGGFSTAVASNISSIDIDSSDNVYVTGTYIDAGGLNNGFIVKYNSSGTLQWQRNVKMNGNSTYITHIRVTTNNYSIVVTGFDASNNQGFVMKVPVDGTLTGTFGAIVYSSDSLTESTPALGVTNRTTTASSFTTLNDAAETMSQGSTSLTKTTTTVA